jgi:hypothetical protein
VRESIDYGSGRVFFRDGLCPLGSWRLNSGGRARNREMILSVGVIGSSMAVCIACVVVTTAVVAER